MNLRWVTTGEVQSTAQPAQGNDEANIRPQLAAHPTPLAGGMSSPSKRREMDVMKLCAPCLFLLPVVTSVGYAPRQWRSLSVRMISDYKVTLVDDNPADIHVIFHGPKDSARNTAPRAPAARL